jgi:hypothetical protein
MLKNEEPATPSSWFVERYPEAYQIYGSPFAEVVEGGQVLPACINYDFFGAVLGGRQDLGHHVVYLESELAWYFKDSNGIYKATTSDKLQIQYRALMMKAAQDMPPNVHKLNLVNEWRSDRVCKSIISRAKSILSADQTFFSPTSPHQRIQGPELHERLMRVVVESMLQPAPDSILTVTQAYQVFCRLAQQRGLGMLKRSVFKAEMKDLVRNTYSVSLRHDVKDASDRQQQGWRGIKLVEA